VSDFAKKNARTDRLVEVLSKLQSCVCGHGAGATAQSSRKHLSSNELAIWPLDCGAAHASFGFTETLRTSIR
jgi:hypothetical protein